MAGGAEYGALRGMTMEWTHEDLVYSQEQRSRMMAQRALGSSGEGVDAWSGYSAEQRQILAAVECGTITPAQASEAFRTLEQSSK